MKEKIAFREIFKEEGPQLVLRVDARVKGQEFSKGFSFTESEKLGTVNFHKYRYLDLAVEKDTNDCFDLVGFYPSN